MADYKNNVSEKKGKVIYNIGIVKGIVRLAVEDVSAVAIQHKKKIAIIGWKTKKIVNQAINLGYLNIPADSLANLRYIDGDNKNDDKDLVVIVTGERHEPYFMLQRMARGIDRLINLTKDDTVVVLTSPRQGTEKMAVKTLDIVYHITSKVKEFSSNLIPSYSADREEIKQMINILRPKYVIPVIGEYRHQYSLRIVANCIGYKDDKILICDNGDITSFVDGKYMGVTGSVPCGEVLIDGKAFKDVGDVVMRDRELLADDGVILIVANINPRTKEVIVGPEVITKGFTYQKDSEDLLQDIKNVFNELSAKNLQTKFINWSDFKMAIKNEISHYVYKTVKRNPIIIPVLISTDIEVLKSKLE